MWILIVMMMILASERSSIFEEHTSVMIIWGVSWLDIRLVRSDCFNSDRTEPFGVDWSNSELVWVMMLRNIKGNFKFPKNHQEWLVRLLQYIVILYFDEDINWRDRPWLSVLSGLVHHGPLKGLVEMGSDGAFSPRDSGKSHWSHKVVSVDSDGDSVCSSWCFSISCFHLLLSPTHISSPPFSYPPSLLTRRN